MKVAGRVIVKRWPPAITIGDVAAGLSVALVLVPQSLAYAELAGLPAHVGLYAAAFPAIAASLFASSPYLQTGPTAMASLLTVGVVSAVVVADGQYAATAALLAILVGIARVLVGIFRSGRLAYLLSQTVLTGFASGAALLIIASQVPDMLGADPRSDGVLGGLASVSGRPDTWERESVLLALLTAILMVGGRRLHAYFPGALLAAVLGIGWSLVVGYTGPTIGDVPTGLPGLALDLPWGSLSDLLVPALAIALVGFAEPAAIARSYAARDRVRWDPDREWLSQGIANIASGLFGGFPVGGSFSRSALARAAGTRTRWSGAVAGLAVLAFLPFAWLLAPLPEAVLAAIVTTSVLGLLRPSAYPELWRRSHPQLGIALFTMLLTLAFAPRVELGVLGGLGLAVAIHLWRELRIDVAEWEEAGTLHLKPQGVLWFATAQDLWDRCVTLLAHHPEARRVVVHLDGLGRVDLSGMLALQGFVQDAQAGGIDVVIADVPPQTERLVRDVLGDED